MIPLLELKALNAPMQAEIEAALLRVARSGRYILGPEVEAFEAEWAAYCGTRHCVGTGNGLDALKLLLLALEVGEGDEVIVPGNTFIATWLAVSHCGGTPVPADPLEETYNLDPRAVEAAIGPKTVGIVAVHLYGEPAPMAELRTLAERHHLFLVEDAAQAQGAMYMGRRAGALSNGGAFSFYPSKNLGALGDAGAVTTDDAAIAESVRRHRAYGGQGNGRLDHILMGHNSRLDELQAAVLRVKLRHLDAMNAARRERAALYRAALDGHCGLGLPPENGGSVYHQFVVRSRERDALRQRLAVAGVDAHVHYPGTAAPRAGLSLALAEAAAGKRTAGEAGAQPADRQRHRCGADRRDRGARGARPGAD
jgi:dTDP-4-amino-4,6-dideoxygalactose transaminase